LRLRGLEIGSAILSWGTCLKCLSGTTVASADTWDSYLIGKLIALRMPRSPIRSFTFHLSLFIHLIGSDYKQQWITDRFMLLSDSLDDMYTRDTATEQVQSGLTIYDVMDQRLLLATVLIMAGAHTAAIVAATDPAMMCQSDALVPKLPLRLSRLRHLAAVEVSYRKNKALTFSISANCSSHLSLISTTPFQVPWFQGKI